jgi:hypothetical protein
LAPSSSVAYFTVSGPNRAYYYDVEQKSVLAIDVATGATLGRIPGPVEAIGLGRDGNVYTVDGPGRVRVYDASSFRRIRTFGRPSSDFGRQGKAIAVSPTGDTYVTNREIGTIDIYAQTGRALASIRDVQLAGATSFDRNGDLYVVCPLGIGRSPHGVYVFRNGTNVRIRAYLAPIGGLSSFYGMTLVPGKPTR